MGELHETGLGLKQARLRSRIMAAALAPAAVLFLFACSSTPVKVARPDLTWPPPGAAKELGLPDRPKVGGEIRVWLGGGIVRPYDLYRFCETPGGTTGEHISWTEIEEPGGTRSAEDAKQWNNDMRAHLKDVACHSDPRTSEHYMFCAHPADATKPWNVVVKDLMPAELWKLPEELDRKCGWISSDGEIVTIEILTATRRHVVQYDNPDFCCSEIPCAIADHVRAVVRRID